jgi:hypothetical protein
MAIILGITGRRYERQLGFELHNLRAKAQGFKPLNETQYWQLCNKIEDLPK